MSSTTASILPALASVAASSGVGRTGPLSSLTTVGVVGLGHMGSALALNLLDDGYRVMALDRESARVAALHDAGADSAHRLADLAGCDVVLTSLPDDHVLAAVALGDGGLVHLMKPGAVDISMSTVSPALSRELDAAHEVRQQGYVAAPVLGNPDLARARRLFILAGGRPAAVEKAQPVLDRLGERLSSSATIPARPT